MANGYSTEQNVGSDWPASQISPLFGPKSEGLMPKLPGCTRKMMANPMMPRWYGRSLCPPRPWGCGQRQSSRHFPCERQYSGTSTSTMRICQLMPSCRIPRAYADHLLVYMKPATALPGAHLVRLATQLKLHWIMRQRACNSANHLPLTS